MNGNNDLSLYSFNAQLLHEKISFMPSNWDLSVSLLETCQSSSQGSQIRQIWHILRQNFSHDSTEVTEGVTSTPQKFSVTNREPLRLQKFTVTNTVLSLPFSQQIQFTLIVNVVNLN